MNAAIEESRAAPLRRFLAGFALALMATSWPLWTPQHVFPQVPAFAALGRLPDAWQWLCLAGVLAALIAALVAPRDSVLGPRSLLLFGLLMPVLMASDQHRWQPWAYQLVLTSLPLATLSAAESWPLLRLLTVSIYLYSGWSKCDVTFLDDLGQQFVARLMAVVHDPSLDQWSLEVRRAVAGALAIGELLIGGALLWGRTRRVGLWAAVASHLALLLILGPWGLGHKPPVLLWNIYFIVQDVLLFAGPMERLPAALRRVGFGRQYDARVSDAPPPAWPRAGPLVKGLIWLALLAPLLSPWGYCDHWLAWGLYSSRAERVRIFIPRSQQHRLPAAIEAHLSTIAGEADWLELRADRWSLATLGVPLYPQNRFQLAVALAIGRELQPASSLRVICYTAADRWNGRRTREILSGLPAIEEASHRFWLNARPR